ncbi:MAG TPA: hypothetical protein VEB67_00785 [Nitrososphaerales archaeon]|nr:hypothetical protein [Nitrososphaerales archaeon]
MASDVVVTVLAFGHILFAMGWLGGGLLTAFGIGPSLRKLAPPAAMEFNAKVIPRMVRFIEVSIGLTFLFGLGLLYTSFNGDFSFLMNSTQGYVLSTGILLALVAGAVGFSVVAPSFRRVSRLSAAAIESGQPPSPEMMKYAKRAAKGSMVGAVLLLLVLLMMVTSGFHF